jgi:hypothetical protein
MRTGELPKGVYVLRARIERWRQRRAHPRAPMPAELWGEAVSWARQGRPHGVSRALGVNYNALRRRVAEQEAAGRGVAGSTADAFVEVCAGRLAPLLGVSDTAACVLEVANGDGARLTLRLASPEVVDVAAVVRGFVERRP